MLTVQQLIEMEPDTIFAKGVITNSEQDFNIERAFQGRLLKWVAQRGGIHDWCITVHWDDTHSFEQVAEYGDKMVAPSYIKRLVPCDDESFNMYRK